MLVTYLSSGGKVGDKLQVTAVCDKSRYFPALTPPAHVADPSVCSWQDPRLYHHHVSECQGRAHREGKPHEVGRRRYVVLEIEARLISRRYVTQAWGAHPSYTPPEGAEIDDVD